MAVLSRGRGAVVRSHVLDALLDLWEMALRSSSAGNVTQQRLAAESGVAYSTLNSWLNRRSAPRELDQVVRVAEQLARLSGTRPYPRGHWSGLQAADRDGSGAGGGERGGADGEDTATPSAVPEGAAEEPGQVEPPALGVPLSGITDPVAFGVRPAIKVAGPAQAGLPVLTSYVERALDRQLERLVERAGAGDTLLAVLIGEPATGRTRAAWEALDLLGPDWRLWQPIDPSDADEWLTGRAEVVPYTVIWLDDLHLHLAPSGRPLLGERIAARLRVLLTDPGAAPVLVLGTIGFPDWRSLTAVGGESAGSHRQARELLIRAETVDVPAVLEPSDPAALPTVCAEDPRLAHAVAHAQDRAVIQYLAAGPELLRSYRNGPPAARAVVEAAMDALRLGHRREIPREVLAAAAPYYLSDREWEAAGPDWLSAALDHLGALCRGATAPLVACRPRAGAAEPRYALASYLEQYGRADRRGTPVPAGLWQALTAHAGPQDAAALARSADARGLRRTALALHTRAAGAGDIEALLDGAALLGSAGRIDEALRWYERACADGAVEGLSDAADLLEGAERIEEAVLWHRRAGDAGDLRSARRGIRLLRRLGRIDEALAWSERVAGTGDVTVLYEAGELLTEHGSADQALGWYERAAAFGHPEAMRAAARLHRRAGRTARALGWLERAAGAGSVRAAYEAVELLEQEGRIESALAWLDRLADIGDEQAPTEAAALRARHGQLVRPRGFADYGDHLALLAKAEQCDGLGQVPEALDWYRRAADAGSAAALFQAADMLERHGRASDAEDWYEQAAAGGDAYAMRELARLAAGSGREWRALEWCRAALAHGNRKAVGDAAELLGRLGRVVAAAQLEHWSGQALPPAPDVLVLLDRVIRNDAPVPERRSAGWTGDDPVREAAELLRESGRSFEADLLNGSARDGADRLGRATRMLHGALGGDAAIRWAQRQAAAGDAGAARDVAEMLEQAGRTDEAVEWYRQAARAGDVSALRAAARLLAEHDELDRALDCYRDAAMAGDPAAFPDAVQTLRAGLAEEEAERLRRWGWEPDGEVARPWSADPPAQAVRPAPGGPRRP